MDGAGQHVERDPAGAIQIQLKSWLGVQHNTAAMRRHHRKCAVGSKAVQKAVRQTDRTEAIGQHDLGGFVLDVLVRNRRDTKAAKRLLGTLLKKQARRCGC